MRASSLKKKKLIVFDLDGTLTESKSLLKADMAAVLRKLLQEKFVAIIGGGKYEQFQKQFVSRFRCPPKLLSKLFLFPTTSTAFYRYRNGWKKIYRLELSKEQRQKIFRAFERVFRELEYKHPAKTYGPVIEDRGTQVSFSPYGQEIVSVLGQRGIAIKAAWGAKPWRMKIAKRLQKYLPEFEVRCGGLSTIDVTRRGIDKAYGLRQIQKHLKIPINQMLFIGDAIFPGGNDYAVTKTKVQYIRVSGPKETKKIISEILSE